MLLTPLEQLALTSARLRDEQLAGEAERRRRHGIVHTPPELARFVVRAVDQALRSELGVTDGIGDPRVDIVDPACGPGAFLAAALDAVACSGGRARVVGLDADAEALALAAKLAAEAKTLGLQLAMEQVDTLRKKSLLARLADPARTLVVIGNPPWTVSASQPTAEMQTLLEDFRRGTDGERLPERKLGVLADAYVRFVRWAAELARARPAGAVVGLVTNASFLDGPVHRGMRAALRRWFDLIDVVDLGGNALLGRERGAALRDGNVFGVRPGVAVSVCVRRAGQGDDRGGRVRHARLWGSRSDKLEALAASAPAALAWSLACGADDGARFVPTVRAAPAPCYASWPSLAEWMPFHREGVQSNRDAAVVDTDPERLLSRLRAFVAQEPRAELRQAETRLAHYDPERARAAVAAALVVDPHGDRGLSVRRLAYRPFDVRYFCPVAPFCHRPRPELRAAFEHGGVALVTVRKDRGSAPYTHFAAVTEIIDNCYLSARSSCRARSFTERDPEGRDNLSARLCAELSQRIGGPAIDAHTFVRYALAVLAAPSYRARFTEELRQDYPRIAWPRDLAELAALAAVGERLVGVFLQDRADPPPPSGAALSETLRVGHHAVSEARNHALSLVCREADALVSPLLDAAV